MFSRFSFFQKPPQPQPSAVLESSSLVDQSDESISIDQEDVVSLQISSDEDSLQELLARDYDIDRRHFKIVFLLINLIAAVQVAIIIYILTQWLDGFRWHPDEARASDFNVHLICTVLACVVIDAYGILIFRAFPNHPHRTLAVIHTIIMIIVVLVACFGIKISYDSHHIYGRHHLYSLHSWMGVTIFCLLFFELVTGNWLFFNEVVHASLQYWHKMGGMMIFFLSLAATVSGILTAGTRSMKQNLEGDAHQASIQNSTLNVFGLLATVFSILVRYLYTGYRFRRRPRPGLPDQDLTEQEVVLAIVRNIREEAADAQSRHHSYSGDETSDLAAHRSSRASIFSERRSRRSSVAPPRRLMHAISVSNLHPTPDATLDLN